MEILKELVRNIVLLIILTTFLDMLLPSNKMRSYLKMVMGLFVLVSIINPLVTAVFQSQDLAAFSWTPVIAEGAGSADVMRIRQAGLELSSRNEEQVLASYASRLGVQMASLVKIMEGVKEAEVKVELTDTHKFGSSAGIKNIRVTLLDKAAEINPAEIRIDPVRIGGKDMISVNSAPQQEVLPETLREQIIKMLSLYFNVLPEQITVNGGGRGE